MGRKTQLGKGSECGEGVRVLASERDIRDRRSKADSADARIRTALPDVQLLEIRTYTRQQRARGSTRFQAMVGEKLGRCVVVQRRGNERVL